MRLRLAWMSVWASALLCGCASRGNVDMLESQLRRQEDQIYSLRRELKRTQSELTTARRESNSLRTQVADSDPTVPAPEQSTAFHRIESIALHKLMTGGLDRDGSPGHDHLSAVIMPLDSEGEVVKSPGTLHLELMDLSKDGPDRRIGVWEFSPEQTEKFWKRSLIGTGYAVQTPFQQTPQSERLTLHARLITVDGRQFDTTADLSIDTAGSASLARTDRKRAASVVRKPKPVLTPRSVPAPAKRPSLDTSEQPVPPPSPDFDDIPMLNRPNESDAPLRQDSTQWDSEEGTDDDRFGKIRQVSTQETPEFIPDESEPVPQPSSRTTRKLRPLPRVDPDANSNDSPSPLNVRQSLRPTNGDDGEKRPPRRGVEANPRFDVELDRQPISIPTSDRWTDYDRPTVR